MLSFMNFGSWISPAMGNPYLDVLSTFKSHQILHELFATHQNVVP